MFLPLRRLIRYLPLQLRRAILGQDILQLDHGGASRLENLRRHETLGTEQVWVGTDRRRFAIPNSGTGAGWKS